jgi:hypothetical protein
LTARAWFATLEERRTGRFTRLRVVELDPAIPLPPGTTLLCVAGDSRWDRVAPEAKINHAGLFARPPTASRPIAAYRNRPT